MKRFRNSITFKSISGIVLLLTLFAGIISSIGYKAFSDALYKEYTDGAFRIARAAAKIVDADRLDSYFEDGGSSEEYQDIWRRMDALCSASEAMFIYVIRPSMPDYGEITFVFSTVDHNSQYTPYEVGYVRTTTNDEYRQKYRAMYEGESDHELMLLNSRRYEKSQYHITAMVPLKGTDGETKGILCVQLQLTAVTEVRHTFVRRVWLVMLLMTALVVLVQSAYLNRVFIRPIKTITDEATRFANENHPPQQRLTEQIKITDEIGVLAGSIDRMEEQIDQYISNLTSITAEKERIIAELSLAKRLQEAMLVRDFPPFPDRTEFDLYATMDPAREVGGDFYDFFLIDKDHLCLVIADVSGKGIPAALFMMISKTIFQSCAMLGQSAADILTKTNEGICTANKLNMFVTAWVGILELSSGKLRAASAGHEYPVLKRADGTYTLYKDRHGLPIGAMEGVQYQEYELQLEPGDQMFLYTDGVPEATDTQNRMFGTIGILEVLNRNPNAAPEEQLNCMKQALDAFVGEAEQFDDITMLGLVYNGAGENENTGTP